MFDNLTASEQACIREEIENELLEYALTRPVLENMPEITTEQWEVSMFSCLASETARQIASSAILRLAKEEQGYLHTGNHTCMMLSAESFDMAELVAANAAGHPAFDIDLRLNMLVCAPELVPSAFSEMTGVELGEWNDVQMACFWEWVTGLSESELRATVAQDDKDTIAALISDLNICADPIPEGSIGFSNCPPSDGLGPTVLDFDGPQPMCLDESKQYTAVFDTTAGEMRIDLDMVNTPITANNFAVLARYHYYDDTLLFRTDPGIGIIQGGAPHTNSPSDPGPGYTIADEGSGFTYEPGQIVMARTGAPNSASAQFFFAVNENTALLNGQGTYVVFGQMDNESLTVAEAILASHVDQPGNRLGGGPEPQVIVNSITIEVTG